MYFYKYSCFLLLSNILFPDVNECIQTPDICGAYGTCQNTQGGHRCECQRNFRPDPATNTCVGKFNSFSVHNNLIWFIKLYKVVPRFIVCNV